MPGTLHLLPNALGPVIVASTIEVSTAIIAESTLSFLGLGFPPDIPTWGRILFDSKEYLDIAPHWALFPGTAIFLAVLALLWVRVSAGKDPILGAQATASVSSTTTTTESADESSTTTTDESSSS